MMTDSFKYLVTALTKAQILLFLGFADKTKTYKKQLVEQLLTQIEQDPALMVRLLNTFPQELAVEPVELCQVLQCTNTERLRWIKEGKLAVLEYRPFRLYGTEYMRPVHDRRVVMGISQATITEWRVERIAAVEASRQDGSLRARQSRATNQHLRQNFLETWQATIAQWQEQGSPDLATVFQLAYWAVWTSRWAKEYQLKARRAIKYATRYAALRDTWYERKLAAMCTLARTPYAQLSFYIPEEPDKYTLHLCEKHYEMKREGYYHSIWEFFCFHADLVKKCPDCVYHVEQHFYSLYHLEVMAETIQDTHFSFHIPYPIGKAHFPMPERLRRVEHVEQDGAFRFGRSLLPAEKILHREQDVLHAFEQALIATEKIYSR